MSNFGLSYKFVFNLRNFSDTDLNTAINWTTHFKYIYCLIKIFGIKYASMTNN